jgi:hypothetical protein
MKRRLTTPPLPRRAAAFCTAGGSALLAMIAIAQDVAVIDEPAFVSEVTQLSATVMDIQPDSRLVSLRTDEGQEFTVQAGEDVRNFDQIEVGDEVNVAYYEALAAEVTTAPPSDDDEGVVVIDTTRAPIGEDPAGAVGLVYTAIVTIDEVDPESNTVAFTGPEGEPRQLTVQRPEMQEFIRGLNEGDRVQVTYGEALAVSVTPAN